ncbi:AraC family transcriptional regulator [Mycolicibacterium septicum]|uniref:AraC family transcriptional regulator n=1 Tax=Mycolicibacterium septicum TaxID=98668 RepID=UPI00235F4823|nr:AraC family transcriptional regulator [Mycolicibacterium septicum]
MENRELQTRYAALTGFLDVAGDIGVDAGELFARAGLDLVGLTQPDRWESAEAVAGLLEDAAACSGCDDVGLRLAENRHLTNLGPMSLVIRDEPRLGDAVQTLIRYSHMLNEALRVRVVEAGEIATVRLELNVGGSRPPRQSIELAVATLVAILTDLAGASWHPLATCFSHPQPSNIDRHRRLLGQNLSFDGDFNGIVLRSTDLDISNALADPSFLSYSQQLLKPRSDPADAVIVARTREVIELLLPAGRCSVDHVARSLGTNRRTLHRQLQSAGTTFTDLLDTTRVDLAKHLLTNHNNSLTDISVMLMFSTPGNFTRWFRQRFGVAPRTWRQQGTAPK